VRVPKADQPLVEVDLLAPGVTVLWGVEHAANPRVTVQARKKLGVVDGDHLTICGDVLVGSVEQKGTAHTHLSEVAAQPPLRHVRVIIVVLDVGDCCEEPLCLLVRRPETCEHLKQAPAQRGGEVSHTEGAEARLRVGVIKSIGGGQAGAPPSPVADPGLIAPGQRRQGGTPRRRCPGKGRLQDWRRRCSPLH
jgi:hypothetical protein